MSGSGGVYSQRIRKVSASDHVGVTLTDFLDGNNQKIGQKNMKQGFSDNGRQAVYNGDP